MKKFFKRLFLLLMIVIIAAVVWFFKDGIDKANEFESRQPLSALVDTVRSNPQYVPYDQVSPSLYQATIAIEDARYYQHGAVDIKALIRAAASQFISSIPRSGGSTIAMQVVKNLYRQYDGTAVWKTAEIVLAHRLCEMYTKDEILALYVNIINYGDGYHGIDAASHGYYGVEPSQLTQGQATILAGIPQSPGYFQLSDHYDNARAKQKLVLDAMVRNKMIDQAQADAIYQEPNEPTVLDYSWSTASVFDHGFYGGIRLVDVVL